VQVIAGRKCLTGGLSHLFLQCSIPKMIAIFIRNIKKLLLGLIDEPVNPNAHGASITVIAVIYWN
jgi:hypothetical protein